MVLQNHEHDGSIYKIIELDKSHEDGIPKSKSSESREHVQVYNNRVSRIQRYNKWMTGKSAVTLHR
ncbi:MAG: hypothetical protein ACFFCP_06075 [Promethearchaeota archaeon]